MAVTDNTETDAVAEPDEWVIIEIMGHRTHAGRISYTDEASVMKANRPYVSPYRLRAPEPEEIDEGKREAHGDDGRD